MTNSDGKAMGVDDRVKDVEGTLEAQDAQASWGDVHDVDILNLVANLATRFKMSTTRCKELTTTSEVSMTSWPRHSDDNPDAKLITAAQPRQLSGLSTQRVTV